MATILYATLEDAKRALDVAETARSNGQILRALNSASRSVEGLTKRRFYPQVDTRFFDWPDRRRPRSWRLWLDGDELISVDTLIAGGETIAPADFFLEPSNTGPPFNAIEIDLGGSSAFQSGDTHQRAIQVTGTFGYTADTEPAGALAAAITDTTSTTVDVTDSAAVGVGDIILVDSEYMIITAKRMLDTGQDLGGAGLTDQKNDVSVAVADGTAYQVDEVILVDSERMLITDIAGNNLIVKRAWDGTVLASHSAGADIFAPRRATVIRGALGSTAATHSSATAVNRHAVPSLVRDLTIAETIDQIQQEQAGYGRTIGEGENQREMGGRGLKDIRAECKTRFGRKARVGAV